MLVLFCSAGLSYQYDYPSALQQDPRLRIPPRPPLPPGRAPGRTAPAPHLFFRSPPRQAAPRGCDSPPRRPSVDRSLSGSCEKSSGWAGGGRWANRAGPGGDGDGAGREGAPLHRISPLLYCPLQFIVLKWCRCSSALCPAGCSLPPCTPLPPLPVSLAWPPSPCASSRRLSTPVRRRREPQCHRR